MFEPTTTKQSLAIEPEVAPAWVDSSMIGNQQFWDWSRRFGFVTGPCVIDGVSLPELVKRPHLFELYDHLQQKVARYWVAFLANVPPESQKAKDLAASFSDSIQLNIQSLEAANA